MSRKIPKRFAEIGIISDILQALDRGLVDLENKTNQVMNDFTINNVSDTNIERYEKILDISNLNLTLELRRGALLSKYRGVGTITPKRLESIAASFSGGEVDIAEHAEGAYIITIIFKDTRNDVRYLQALDRALKEVMPAHLDYIVSVEYETKIGIQPEIRDYEYPFNMCGTFLCGIKPDYSTQGARLSENLRVQSKDSTNVQKYKMAGTFAAESEV
ncbi:putative phage tail protein [Andreesenia angusta]|uniref:putative phage tail protein n=1 Tax=Andreesenia angusta TaxID=39480 RepID=UPI0014719E39|nr:putative phage tail protein [Andreesenia angusta]